MKHLSNLCVIASILASCAFQPALGQVDTAEQPLPPPVYRDSDQPKDSSPGAKLLHFNNKYRVPNRLMVQLIGAAQIEAIKASGSNVGELPIDKESAARVSTEIASRVGAKFLSILSTGRRGKGFVAIFDMTDPQAREAAEDPRVYLIEPDCYAFPAVVTEPK